MTVIVQYADMSDASHPFPAAPPFTGDLATFTDLLNTANTDPSIYRAMVDLGNGTFVSAQVTADTTGCGSPWTRR